MLALAHPMGWHPPIPCCLPTSCVVWVFPTDKVWWVTLGPSSRVMEMGAEAGLLKEGWWAILVFCSSVFD